MRDIPKEVHLATILIFNPSGAVLLIKRANEPFAGQWSLPGGKIDTGELPADAIKRETLEELGLTLREVQLVGNEYYTSPGLAQVHVFVTHIDDGQEFTPNPREVKDICWVQKSELETCEPFPPNHLDILQKNW